MKKIPTIFERLRTPLSGGQVFDTPHPDCAWVFAGEGIATRKMDGTCCLIRDGRLFKRRELKKGQEAPSNFEVVGTDEETGKIVGWVPVGDGPEDRWHNEAFEDGRADGTYELVGPKVQGNPERYKTHRLIPHAALVMPEQPPDRSFSGLLDWLSGRDIEGIVFQHPDGRMGKIKLRDFGLRRMASK